MKGIGRNMIQDEPLDEAEYVWMAGVAREWADDLADPGQDIYTWTDGKPVVKSHDDSQ